MFSIVAEQQQHLTYILKDESSQSQVSIVPERGGIVIGWQIGEMDILYLDKDRYSDPKLSVRGGIPLLFPICGNLPEDTYTLEGQQYSLKQHGFARNLAWEVTNQSTEKDASLTITLQSNEETLKVYPFAFRLDYIYTLQGTTLELRFRHTNLSDKPMPFATGTHPYFVAPDKSQLSFSIPAAQLLPKGETVPAPFHNVFDFEQEEIDVALMPLSSRSAVVNDRSRNMTLTMTYDDHFSTLVFWTLKGKEFYCLEPWSSPRNALNTGESLLHVAPGQTLETIVSLSVAMSS